MGSLAIYYALSRMLCYQIPIIHWDDNFNDKFDYVTYAHA